MSRVNLDYLVGCRFSTIEEIGDSLLDNGAENPYVYESDTDAVELFKSDFSLDGCLNLNEDEDGDDGFTLFYIKDNEDNYYITETMYWS